MQLDSGQRRNHAHDEWMAGTALQVLFTLSPVYPDVVGARLPRLCLLCHEGGQAVPPLRQRRLEPLKPLLPEQTNPACVRDLGTSDRPEGFRGLHRPMAWCTHQDSNLEPTD